MNYLAHFYLSQNNPGVVVGNLLGDFIKGRHFEYFPKPIYNGIVLHRFIDDYTDHFPANEATKELLRPITGKFAGVAMDLIHDHCLGLTWPVWSEQSLPEFVSWVHQSLEAQVEYLTPEAKNLLQAMIKYQWLLRYSTFEGLENSCFGLARRIKHDSGLENVPSLFKENKVFFLTEFERFFPHIVNACSEKYANFVQT
ncbi:MAG: ACP phosphodiesterase [Flavobacteriales bacterium]|nr:ACP phosphodiesterase [Flavobacteriales bacterium]MDP4953188.1 ACP phosphodiesterase [Flavobacteriales bacterium]